MFDNRSESPGQSQENNTGSAFTDLWSKPQVAEAAGSETAGKTEPARSETELKPETPKTSKLVGGKALLTSDGIQLYTDRQVLNMTTGEKLIVANNGTWWLEDKGEALKPKDIYTPDSETKDAVPAKLFRNGTVVVVEKSGEMTLMHPDENDTAVSFTRKGINSVSKGKIFEAIPPCLALPEKK